MRGHVDAESLALYAEGLLSHRRTARVRAHLTGCAECTRTAAALGEVTTRLSQVPAPPLPAAVAARLDAALRAESAGRAASPVPVPAPVPVPVPAAAPAGAPEPRPPRRGPLWSPGALRILAAAGVAVVVAGGVGYGLAQLSGSSSSSSSHSSHSGAAAVPATSGQRAPNAAPNLGTSPGPRIHSGANPGVTGPRYIHSDTDYRADTLAKQAQRKLAVYDVPGITGPGVVPVTQVPAAVLDCVSRIAGTRRVVLVDQARYEQQPAIVIVLDTPGTVKAVSSSCRVLNSAPVPVTSGTGTR